MKISKLVYYILLITLFTSCTNSSEDSPVKYERGSIVESTLSQSYTVENIKSILKLNGINEKDFNKLNYTVDVVRIVYKSLNTEGKSVDLSGVIMIPRAVQKLPLLSIQHGSIFDRKKVASVNILNMSESLPGMVMASSGYLTIIPDHLGYGVSETIHPYLHANSLASSVIDMIKAAKLYSGKENISLNDQLFLYGYSQGGYTTLATQKEIESNYADEFNLTAVAPLAGSYDLAGTVDSVFMKKNYPYLENIAFIFTAYNKTYGWNYLKTIFKDPYGDKMESLFDGSKGRDQILKELPSTFSNLLNENFIQLYLSRKEPKVHNAIQENTLLDWAPKAPIHFFHGNTDVQVPYHNAETAYDKLKSKTKSYVKLTTIQGNHESAKIPAILGMIAWFETFRK